MDVSIIIVSWNTRDILMDCLKSVYEQTRNVQFEVIVIDNASADGSADMVMTKFPSVILIRNLVNRGFAAANNQGIVVARGKYVLLLNSDTVLCGNAIADTVRYAEVHPEAAAVGCQVLENHNAVQMTCFRFPSVGNLFLSASCLDRIFKYNKVLGNDRMLWWQRDSEREVDVISGMFMLVRRTCIDQIGLLDEQYFLYCEEADWCYRFKKAGWKVLFWPGARIIHIDGGSHSSNQVYLKMFIQKQKSLLIFIRKNRGRFNYSMARLILSLSFCFRALIWILIATFKKIIVGSAVNETASVWRHWAAFKFCAFGLQTLKDN